MQENLSPKQKRGLWHKNNRPFVYSHFDGICQSCLSSIRGKWDMAGMSKLEITALNILSAQLRKNKIEDLAPDDITYLIIESYSIAEEFCSFIENKDEKESSSIII